MFATEVYFHFREIKVHGLDLCEHVFQYVASLDTFFLSVFLQHTLYLFPEVTHLSISGCARELDVVALDVEWEVRAPDIKVQEPAFHGRETMLGVRLGKDM